MKTTFIYVLKDPETLEVRYVGKSDKPQVRLYSHFYLAKNRKHHNARWIASLMSRGLRPLLEVIEEVTESEGLPLEAAYIIFFREEGCDLTNATNGGESPMSGQKHSPGALERMRAAHLGEKNHNYGKTWKHSEETREKMRGVNGGENHPNFGKHHTEITRKRISESLRGEKSPNFGIPLPERLKENLSSAQRNNWARMTEQDRKIRSDKMKAGWAKRREAA